MTKLLQDILKEPGELTKSLTYTLGAGRAALGACVLAAQPVEPVGTGGMDGPDGGAERQISGPRDGPAQCREIRRTAVRE